MFYLYPHFFWIADPKDGYDCSNKTYEEWVATGTVSPILGAYFIISGLIIMFLYVLVIWAMTDPDILSYPCYKLMYFNCFVDLGNIMANSVAFGILLCLGAVFCTHPNSCFIFGAIALSCWCSSCFNCIAIAINRCCTMFNFCTFIYKGKLIYIWLSCSFLIMIFMAFFTHHPIFNSTLAAFFYIPFIRNTETEIAEMANSYHEFINIFTAAIINLLYFILCSRVFFSRNAFDYVNTNSRKAQHSLFIQCAIICLPTGYGTGLYIYVQFFAVPKWAVIIASLTYQACSAIPCFTYLIFNSTIQTRVKKMLHFPWNKATPSIHGVGFLFTSEVPNGQQMTAHNTS